ERLSQLRREQLRLFPGGEVTAPVDLVEVSQGRVGVLDPAARRLEDLTGEGGEADRERGRRRSLTGRARGGLSAFPVGPGRRGAGSRQPVQRDVVEDVVAG